MMTRRTDNAKCVPVSPYKDTVKHPYAHEVNEIILDTMKYELATRNK
jgi:hypothetical protein